MLWNLHDCTTTDDVEMRLPVLFKCTTLPDGMPLGIAHFQPIWSLKNSLLAIRTIIQNEKKSHASLCRDSREWLNQCNLCRFFLLTEMATQFNRNRTKLDGLCWQTVYRYVFTGKVHFSTGDFWLYLVSSWPWPLTSKSNQFIYAFYCIWVAVDS